MEIISNKFETDHEKEEDKSDNNLLINTYLDFNIINEGIALSLFTILSLFFIIQKLNDNLMAKWQATLYPLYAYFSFQFLKCFWKIIKTEKDDDLENGKDLNPISKFNARLKIKNFDRIYLISNFISLIFNAIWILSLYNFGEFLDKREDNFLFTALYFVLSICCTQIIYSILRKTSLFSIARNKVEGAHSDSFIAFFSTITGPLLTYLSNMMIICSSSSGVCTQVYMSTIASLLGAFGVSLADFSEYMFPITIILLCISLFSLYIKNKRILHKPFLLGLFSSVLIIISHILDDSNFYYLIYPGNILMIVAAIWNARVNKFYGLPKYSK